MFVKDQMLWMEENDEYSSCANLLTASGFPGEFILDRPPCADRVEAAALAGFMPMSAELPGGTILTPKLHTLRCLLDPASAHVGATARREARRYSIALNLDFAGTLAACVAEHGDDWLTPELASSFVALHDERIRRRVAFISCELLLGTELLAGEIGYLIGGAYASLSGYTSVSGAGTVQLIGLARLLSAHGVRLWDLGMPLEYKMRLGSRMVRRPAYMRMFASAYALGRPEALVRRLEPVSVSRILGPKPHPDIS